MYNATINLYLEHNNEKNGVNYGHIGRYRIRIT